MTVASHAFLVPAQLKIYRRGIANVFGVILPKRRRIASEVSTLWAWQGFGMGGDGRFWTIYTYVALLIEANNCEDNSVCVANNNLEHMYI